MTWSATVKEEDFYVTEFVAKVDEEQPKPKGKGRDIAALVQKDIESRAQLGNRKYGERLLPNNGRDVFMDAYQEALDLCMYLRQLIEER